MIYVRKMQNRSIGCFSGNFNMQLMMNLKHFSLNPLADKRKAKMQFFWSLFIYNGTLHVLVERRGTFEYVSCYFLALMCQFIMTGIQVVKSILRNI